MYHKVYTPSGEMFEVPAHRASKLIREGWTLSYPEDLTNVFPSLSEEDWDEDDAAIFEEALASFDH